MSKGTKAPGSPMQVLRIVVIPVSSLPAFILILALTALAACGSGEAKNTPAPKNNPAPVITQLTVTCNPSTVPNGDTSQCTSTRTYSDASTEPADCDWSADKGSIDTTGLFTAPTASEMTTSPETATITCDDTIDPA